MNIRKLYIVSASQLREIFHQFRYSNFFCTLRLDELRMSFRLLHFYDTFNFPMELLLFLAIFIYLERPLFGWLWLVLREKVLLVSWLVVGANLVWEKNIVGWKFFTGWLGGADLVWEKNIFGYKFFAWIHMDFKVRFIQKSLEYYEMDWQIEQLIT